MKSSLPMALCLMVNGRWSDATTFRVSLRPNKSEGRGFIHDIMLHLMCDFMGFLLTFPAGSLGNWEYWDPGGGGAR